MKNYVIDLTGIESKEDLHDSLFKGLESPEHYGRNLDALHDVLTSLTVPCRIAFQGYEAVSDVEESLASYLRTMRKVCEDSAKELPGLDFVWEESSAISQKGDNVAMQEEKKGNQDESGSRPKKISIDPSKSPFYKKCFVCGPDNEDGLHLRNRYIDGKAHMEFTPTERMIGLVTKKGSLMHGGFTSMIFDEVMTYVMMGRGIETVTLNMSIDYVSPARTGNHMTAEAWIERVEGRKLWAAAAITDDVTGETVAKATGLYNQVDLKKFIDGIDGDNS